MLPGENKENKPKVEATQPDLFPVEKPAVRVEKPNEEKPVIETPVEEKPVWETDQYGHPKPKKWPEDY